MDTKPTGHDDLLSPRTPRHISKHRSNSVVPADAPPRTSSRQEHMRSLASPTQPVSPASPDSLTPPVTRYRTPSMSSVASLSSRTSVANFDVHTLYKIKTTNSTKKLNSFFGEMPPMDICLREIEKEGLKAMMQSKVPLCYFLLTALQEYCSENLFFFIEVEQYETFDYINKAQQLATAQHIFSTYLTNNSHFEINIDDKSRKAVTNAIQSPDGPTGCFNVAKRAVFALLDNLFQRFKVTGWNDMVKDLGELNTHYNEATRNLAVNKLLQFFEVQHDLLYTNPHTDFLVPNTSRRRNELLKSMVHEFCRTLLGVEFNYYRPEPANRTGLRSLRTVLSPTNSDAEGSASESESKTPVPKMRGRSKSFVAKKNNAFFGKKQKGSKA